MKRKLFRIAAAVFLAALLAPLWIFARGWVKYRLLEKSVIQKMDQYYLNITTPGREEYFLEDDETFEIPYMASRLSIEAAPTRIFDVRGRLMGEYVAEKGLYVRDPEDLPEFLKRALVATEDRTFYSHHGINYRAIARAMLVNLRSLRIKQGGSTLTQQLAKMMFTTRKKTFGRKVYEAFCARKLEKKFTKDQILLMYLNFLYFGHGAYGVESASRLYFGKETRSLRLAECALLAGIIASPNNYSPFRKIELAKARHRTVLRRMARLGYIPSAAAERYSKEFWNQMKEEWKTPEVSFWRMRVNKAPYFIEYLRQNLEKSFSRERITRGGLNIHTTIDIDYQKAAKEALSAGLKRENEIFREMKIEGALIALSPHDGAILAMVGGSGYNFANQLNRAVNIRRSLGSSIKPLVYAAAFESGKFSPEDTMDDKPKRYRKGWGKYWQPRNYGDRYYGVVSLTEALRKSINTVAVKVLSEIDIDKFISLLAAATNSRRDSFPRNLSLALGTAGASPLQTACAYSMFANGGRKIEPYFIRHITDRDENIVYKPERHREGQTETYQETPMSETLISTRTCRLITKILKGVFKPGGTAYYAARRTGFNIPAAGKTGTTSDFKDAWFTGYTPDIAAVVWMGCDDMRISLGEARTGGRAAAPVWMRFIKEIYRNRPTRQFDIPESNR